MTGYSFFSGRSGVVVAVLLLSALLWAIYTMGGTALSRWLG